MNRVQVDVTAFESLYQEYILTKEELETKKEEILAEMRGSTCYFASARADRHRADIEAFYETGTGKEALTQAEGMIKATKKATESFMALQDYCLKLENFDSGIPAMGTASIEDGVSHSQFVFDPDAKKAFHTAKASMIADAMLVRNLLVQVADSLEQYGRSVSSDEIRSAYEQVKTIDNLDKALDILESETESAISEISGMLAGQISNGTLSGLSADEVMQIEEIKIEIGTNRDDGISSYPLYNKDQINNISKGCQKYYEHNRILLDKISYVNYDKYSDALVKFKEQYINGYETYLEISKTVNMPPELIAVIHYRENTSDYLQGTFNVYLHNGQNLGQVTTKHPANIYYDDFVEAAIDAINGKMEDTGIKGSNTMDLVTMLTFLESYNGYGYAKHDNASPYLFSGTNVYVSGKYVEEIIDGKMTSVYKPDVVDQQLGAYLLLTDIMTIKE